MNKQEVPMVNAMQLRLPKEMKDKILDGAKKSFRSAHSEVLYRLQLADEILSKGNVSV